MRKVLVTAGASGIGKEIAAAFLSAGDSVYTCDINQAALDAAARELPGLKTGLCDVGDRKQIESHDGGRGVATRRHRHPGQQRGHLRPDRTRSGCRS